MLWRATRRVGGVIEDVGARAGDLGAAVLLQRCAPLAQSPSLHPLYLLLAVWYTEHPRLLRSARHSIMGPNRSGYQALAQSADDDADQSVEADLSASFMSEGLPAPATASPSRPKRLRNNAPKSIDLSKLDVAFKR